MQANEEVGKVSAATPVAICKSSLRWPTSLSRLTPISVCAAKALELFMEHIITESVEEARSKNSKKITAYHLKRAVHHHEAFDFLKDIVSKVPDPAEKESVNDGDNRGGKRRKTSGSAAGADAIDAASAGEGSTHQSAHAGEAQDAGSSLIRGGQATAPKPQYDEEDEEEDDEEEED